MAKSSRTTPRGRQEPVDDETLVTWWGLVVEGFTRTHRCIDADMRAVEILPGPWFEVLLRLSRSPGRELPLTRLAKEISFSSGGFTKVTDRLVAAGLIERHPDGSDRRVTLARLTSHGAEVLEDALEHHVDSLRRHVLAPLGAERFAELAAAMESIRDANDPPPTQTRAPTTASPESRRAPG